MCTKGVYPLKMYIKFVYAYYSYKIYGLSFPIHLEAFGESVVSMYGFELGTL